MQKLESLDPSGSEYNVVKNFLDRMTLLPWGTHSEGSFDVSSDTPTAHCCSTEFDRVGGLQVSAAKEVLDEEHYGMEDLKERILEFIAMGSLRGAVNGKILILHGPPGVTTSAH